MYVVCTSNHFLVEGERINCSDENEAHLLNTDILNFFPPSYFFTTPAPHCKTVSIAAFQVYRFLLLINFWKDSTPAALLTLSASNFVPLWFMTHRGFSDRFLLNFPRRFRIIIIKLNWSYLPPYWDQLHWGTFGKSQTVCRVPDTVHGNHWQTNTHTHSCTLPWCET